MKNFTLILLLFLVGLGDALAQTTPPCALTVNPAGPIDIYCGDSLELTGSGFSGAPVFESQFNGSTLDPGWTTSQTMMYNNPCGPSLDGTPSAWFGSSSSFPRFLITSSYDLSCGGQICFDIDFAGDDPCGGCSDCEDPDLITEGVYLLMNTGNGWNDTMHYFQPLNTPSTPTYTWNNYCFTFPPNPNNTNVSFQWSQPSASSALNDHWGLDNVSILSGNCGYDYVWDQGGTATADSNVMTVAPGIDTSYTLFYTDGVDTCTANVQVNVEQIVASATASPDSVGCFDCTTLDIVPSNLGPQGLSEDFDPSTNSSMWTSITGANTNGGCSNYYQNSLHFNGASERSAISAPVNTQSCSVLSYCLYMGNGFNTSANCGNPIAGEDIHVDYSTDGGVTFTNMVVYAESIWETSPSWKCYNLTLPVGAQTSATVFRWHQPTFTGSANSDNWSLDAISMTCAPPTYDYVWEPAAQMNDNTLENPQACMADTSQNFIGHLTNTVTGCSATDTVRVTITNCGCEIMDFNAAIDTCQGNGTFIVNGDVRFLDNPATGDLIYEATNSSGTFSYTEAGPFTEDSVYTFQIDNIPSDGSPLSVIVYFADEDTCSDTLYYTSPIAPTYLGGTGDSVYCAGEAVADIELLVSGTGPFDVNYRFNGTPTVLTSTTPTISLGNNEGQYIIDTIFDATCYYVVNDTFDIVINPLPNVFAGSDQLICENDNVTLIGQGADTYTWDNGVQDGVAFSPAVGIQMYTVTGTDVNSCVNTDSVEVTVEALPVVDFSADVTMGCMPLTVNFTNNTQGNLTNCEWFINGQVLNGCNGTSYTFDFAGSYDVELTTTSANGCTNTLLMTDYITVYELPNAEFDASTFLIDNIESTVEFYNQSTGASNYYWDFGDGTDSVTTVDPIYEFDGITSASFNVELTAVSANGCINTVIHPVILSGQTIYYIPNSFTPNGDEYNNYFQAVFTSGFDPYNFEMVIYNRWGEQVFITNDSDAGWDGTYNGKLVPEGPYTYKISYKSLGVDERSTLTGTVTVLK